MKCVFIFVSFLAASLAAGYGKGGGYSSGGLSRGSRAGMSLSSGRRAIAGQVIPVAIRTLHNIEFRDVPSSGSLTPATIEVDSQSLPLVILFRSSSSSLNVQQAHDGASGSTQETSSEDEPHRLIHSVTKPIIQEVREVITPFRKITQEIQPVQEEIQTIVARNVGQAVGTSTSSGFAGGFGGSNLGLGGSIGAGLSNSLLKTAKSLGSGLKGKTSDSYSSGVKFASSKSY